MIGKLLVTLTVFLLAYGVFRARVRADRRARGLESARSPWPPLVAVRLAAGIALAAMAVGSALYVLEGWLDGQTRVRIQVVNANTGRITAYEARRGTIEGRRFTTLDGREIRLADVERMIIRELDSDPPP
jgi:hypothetical protein